MKTKRRYEILYVDFPWFYTPFGTAKLPYKPMTEEEIGEFDLSRFRADRCVMFSWATWPKLDIAMRCGEHWAKRHGMHYQGAAYLWVKTKKDGTPIKAAGPRPRLVKPITEVVLAYSSTKNGRTFPLLTESQKQTIFAPKPARGQHSRKPPETRDRIVELLGDRPRIELFARERVRGWAGWGDEYPTARAKAPRKRQ